MRPSSLTQTQGACPWLKRRPQRRGYALRACGARLVASPRAVCGAGWGSGEVLGGPRHPWGTPGGPRRAQESPGQPRRAQEGQGSPREAQGSPGEPTGARQPCKAKSQPCRVKGLRKRVILYNRLTPVRRWRSQDHPSVWAVELNLSLALATCGARACALGQTDVSVVRRLRHLLKFRV